MNQKTIFISSLALVVLLFVGGTLFYNQTQSAKHKEQAAANLTKLIRQGAPTKGDPNAKVQIVEFFDPACGTCARFHPFVEDLIAKNPGKIKIMARYAPFHKGSDYMVKILEAARMQGKFWQTLEIMFATQSEWASHSDPQPQRIWNYLGSVGLDMEKMGADLNSPEIDRIIKQDLQDAADLKVTKTPEFFVNGRPLPRFGYDPLRDLVAEEISLN